MAKQNNVKEAETPVVDKFAGFVEEQVGFAPYFEPRPDTYFYGILNGVDMADPKFLRYTFTAAEDVECFTGPADDQVPVTVHEGETFTCSVYAQLRDRFDEYLALLGEGVVVPVRVRVFGKSEKTTKAGFKYWEFGISVSAENKQMLLKYRSQRMNELKAAMAGGAHPATLANAGVG
jgi:hypothetical protein